MSAERRTSPRIQLDRRVRAEAVSDGRDVRIVDLSLGGFLVESPTAFAPGSGHEFRVTVVGRPSVILLRATAVYCHRRASASAAPTYVSGFAFLDALEPEAKRGIDALMDEATAMRSVAGDDAQISTNSGAEAPVQTANAMTAAPHATARADRHPPRPRRPRQSPM